jgi:uncharacterized protein involved in exopolysaccharide biosynthesis
MASTSADPVETAAWVDWLSNRIEVVPVRDTRLVDVRVEDSDPRTAQVIADRLTRLFVDYREQRSVEGDTTSLAFLANRLDEVKSRIDEANRRYAAAGAGRLPLLRARASHLRTSLASAGQGNSENARAIRRELLDRQAKLAAARGVYQDLHPRMVELKQEVVALQSQLASETQRSPGRVSPGQRSVQSALARSENELAAVEGRLRRQSGVVTELKVDQELYERLLIKAREMGLDEQLMQPAVAIVSPAAVEPDPVRPRKLLNLFMCLMAGTLAGGGMALSAESLRRTVRDADDAQEQLGLPVIAVIPRRP